MQEYFEREIKNLKRELTFLKTSSQRSASNISTTSQTLSLSVPLEYIEHPPMNPSARAERRFEIITEKPALIVPTLSWYFEDLSRPDSWYYSTRVIELNETVWANGNYGITLYFIGTELGDNNDAERLARGETVTIDVNLAICSTADFTIREYNGQ